MQELTPISKSVPAFSFMFSFMFSYNLLSDTYLLFIAGTIESSAP